jgi:Spy/CpxP family protein refolding chaperone
MEQVMRRILSAFMIALATAPGLIVLAAAPSHAQFKKSPPKDQVTEPKKKEDDSQYKAAIERLPEKKFDPWQNMR